jgi:hypothetical protein
MRITIPISKLIDNKKELNVTDMDQFKFVRLNYKDFLKICDSIIKINNNISIEILRLPIELS